MLGSTIFDTKDFITRLDEEFKWDKVHKKECGWDDHDITMIAEGMLQATEIINKMQFEAHQEKKEYKEIIYAHWKKVPLKKYPEEVKFQCSTCGCPALAQYNYCASCGATMIAGQQCAESK